MIVKDEMGKESDEERWADYVANDQEMKGKLVLGRKMNDRIWIKIWGYILHADSGIRNETMVNDEVQMGIIVPVNIVADVKEGCEESKEDSITGNDCCYG